MSKQLTVMYVLQQANVLRIIMIRELTKPNQIMFFIYSIRLQNIHVATSSNYP